MCSNKTLNQLRILLEGVVENGTAKNLKNAHYRIAGKTGTAQILENGRYEKRYITSFVGYFPAHAPKYSAIVLIKNPRGFYQYGNNVAGRYSKILPTIFLRATSICIWLWKRPRPWSREYFLPFGPESRMSLL
ncbi:MAG: penicillin-binding transpeptidase domain-containing protein [Cytophagales bacterium]|nr:penicillin-binding transpeptidase domain-containing protein [Cytophagales bacterium]